MAKRDHRLQYIDFHPPYKCNWEDSQFEQLKDSLASVLVWILVITIAGSLGFIAMQMYALHPIEQILST